MKTIDFGIDLGTTNSLIARYKDGKTEVFTNPIGHKKTLASCVCFRNGRTIVGEKGLDFLGRPNVSVFSAFKRKMGTSEKFFVPEMDKLVSPIDLSALVLKELKNFVYDGMNHNDIVITIPASFDTVQSNATKEAGLAAGFSNVILLQEPIAASLAFANSLPEPITETAHWLVYDLGGGTFDIALVRVNEREMKVIDHEGDNYLGGVDFDNLLLQKVIVPKLEAETTIPDLWKKLTSGENANFKKAYFELLHKAEEAKKALSFNEETDIDMDLILDEGDHSIFIQITKPEFEAAIASRVATTIELLKSVLTNNNMSPQDIDRVVMIGGSTFIPAVKNAITAALNLPVDTSIDPTTAVAEGAAFFASTKGVKETDQELTDKPPTKTSNQNLQYTIWYQKNTQDEEELISINFETPVPDHTYRIQRKDGGYDSGTLAIPNGQISEFVGLLKNQINEFNIFIYDKKGDEVLALDNIDITHGSYNIQGQPLPNDISIEVDDTEGGETKLELIFKKNSILPIKKNIYKTASKTILKGSEEKLIINICEGDSGSLPASNLTVGYIEIKGKDLDGDIIKGTDVEIEIKVTESREIEVQVYTNSTSQEFQNTFSPNERNISLSKLQKDILNIIEDIKSDLNFSNSEENYEFAGKLNEISNELQEVYVDSLDISENEVTDKKYQVDDRKRKLIKRYDELTRHKHLLAELKEYEEGKESVLWRLGNSAPEFRQKYDKIIANEKEIINSGNKHLIKSKSKELDELLNEIFRSDDSNYVSAFYYYASLEDEFKDKKKAFKLIEKGEDAVERKDYHAVKHIVYQIAALVPEKKQRKTLDKEDQTGIK